MRKMLWLISPRENAEIVKMLTAGEISRQSARIVLDIMIAQRINAARESSL